MASFRWSCCGWGCMGVILVPLGVGLVVWHLATSKPKNYLPPERYTPAQLDTARKHIEAAKNQLAQPVGPTGKPYKGKSAPARPVRHIALTEDDLNAYVSSDPTLRARLEKEGIEDARISLKEGAVRLQGSLQVHNRRIWIQTEGPVESGKGGAIYYQPEKVEVGQLNWALPASLKGKLETQVRTRARSAFLRIPGQVKELKVTPGKLSLTIAPPVEADGNR